MEKSSITVALDLLSLEGSGEDATGSTEKAKERLLTASILQSKTSLWKHKLSDLHALISQAEGSPEDCVWTFHLLAESIQRSSDAQLKENCSKWTSSLVHSLQACKCVTIEGVCGALNALLDRVKRSQSTVRDFTSNQLPAVVQGLLWFNSATDPLLQCCTMQVAARCLVHFTTATLQFRNHLKKWAQSGLFSEQLQLSQECGRLLVLLCLNSSMQWTTLVQCLTTALHWTLSTLYQPVLGNPPSPYVSSTIELPSLPIEEPRRSSLLVLEVAVLSQTFCYALKNPPKPASSVAPGVNLEQVLGVAVFGLSMQQHQVTGHSTEKLLLRAVLPVIHTAIWNIILVLTNACGSFLLPYAVHMESNLVQGMTDLAHELKSDSVSPLLSLAIHRALVAWIELRKDFEISFFAPVTKALIQFCQLPSSSKDHTEVKMSGLRALCSLVKTSGPVLPHSVAKIISRFPLDSLSPSLPPEETLQPLELLLACVTSGNRSLAPPLSTAIHVFTEHCTSSNDQQVIDFCRSALAQCSLLQHPAVEPIPPLTSPSLEGSLVAPPSVRPSHYQLRDGSHSRSITPLPTLNVPQTQREVSPVPMETLPSIQPPSFSAKLLPSVSTFQSHTKQSDGTMMEIDLTKEEEIPPETKPKITFISNATSSNEKSLDEWFAAEDDPATTEENKNTLVAKNVATSSSSNLSSLPVPATSTAGLHQPSVQGVGSAEAKKTLSATTTADHAQASSSLPVPATSTAGLHQPSVQGVGNTEALSAPTSADHAQASSSGVAPMQAAKKGDRIVPLRGNNDSDSDSSDVSGLEFFVDKSPDREIID